MANYSTLQEFISKVAKEGLLTASHFNVVIGGGTGGELQNKDVMMMCEATNLPGASHMTNNVITFGENRESPYSITYPALDMSFILDRNMRVKQYFTDWMNQVFNRETRTVGYRANYTKVIDIYVTDKEGNVVHNVKLHECYPRSIADQALSYSSTDFLRLNVSIVFKYWEVVGVNSKGTPTNNALLSIIKNQNSLGSLGAFQVIDTTNISESLGNATGLRSAPGAFGTGSIAGLPREITKFGTGLGSDIYRNASAFNAVTASTPYLNANTGMLGTSINSLGRSSNDFGQALASLGDGIRAVTGPASAMGTAVASMAGTLGPINSAMSALGLGSPFSNVITKLNNVSGQIAVVSNVKGIPGHLSTIGSTMSNMGDIFNSTVGQMKTIPSGSQKLSDAMGNLGKVFTSKGNGTSSLASEIQSGAATGAWQ